MSQVVITPMGLRREDAAKYCGVSLSTFERGVREGRFHEPRAASDRTALWIRTLLDQDLMNLPVSEALPPPNTGAAKPQGPGNIKLRR